MNFLPHFLAPAAFFFAATIPVVIVFYLLKRKRVVRLVASTLLWQKFLAETQASAPFQKLRRNWLLILQIILLILAFSVHFDWFPMLGGGDGFFDQLHHLILPAITLGVVMAAFVMRLTRSALLEVLRRDYIRTARGKGVAERWVIFKHALRNALIPVTTGLGIYLLTTLSGTITVELVFSRPGLGTLLRRHTMDVRVADAGLFGTHVKGRAHQVSVAGQGVAG